MDSYTCKVLLFFLIKEIIGVFVKNSLANFDFVSVWFRGILFFSESPLPFPFPDALAERLWVELFPVLCGLGHGVDEPLPSRCIESAHKSGPVAVGVVVDAAVLVSPKCHEVTRVLLKLVRFAFI